MTNQGINAAFYQTATRAEIHQAARMRAIHRTTVRRMQVNQGRARAGDYVKGIQYAFADGRYLKEGHIRAEGRVVARNGDRITVERGDGARFALLAGDERTRAMNPGETKRYTPERKAAADRIRAERNS